MTCFQIVPVDTTTRAVTVVSGVVSVRGERSAIKTPDTALPVNLGGCPHVVSNVNPFSFFLFCWFHFSLLLIVVDHFYITLFSALECLAFFFGFFF